MEQSHHIPEADSCLDALKYASGALDDVRGQLSRALAVTAPALVIVRLAIVHEEEQRREDGETDG